MAVSVTVAGVTYEIPTSGEDLWGVETTDYLVALGEELANVVVVGDIAPDTLINILEASTQDVTGFIVDGSITRAASAEYFIHRVSTGVGATEVVESGMLFLNYSDSLNAWSLSQVGNGVGNALVTFSMVGSQLRYTSTALPSGTYDEGSMRFRLRALPK